MHTFCVHKMCTQNVHAPRVHMCSAHQLPAGSTRTLLEKCFTSLIRVELLCCQLIAEVLNTCARVARAHFVCTFCAHIARAHLCARVLNHAGSQFPKLGSLGNPVPTVPGSQGTKAKQRFTRLDSLVIELNQSNASVNGCQMLTEFKFGCK